MWCSAEIPANILAGPCKFITRGTKHGQFSRFSVSIFYLSSLSIPLIRFLLVRHSFVMFFFNFVRSNFRPDGSERDAQLYNGFLFQRNREQDSATPYAPYSFYSTLPGNQSIPLQFTPQAAPRSFSQLHGCPEPSTSQIPQPELS